ncbi:MAG TPA: TAXI family TRAP transporter solute-binding subunit [Beijerinckiaceae bacterium]
MRRTILAMAAFAAFSGAAAAQPYNLTIAGYSPGGLVSTVGAGMDAALAAAYPGSAVTYQTSSGGLANAMLLQQGKVPLGFVSDTEILVATEGKPPFKQPVKELRMLINSYTPQSRFQVTHNLAQKSWAEQHGIKTFEDIAIKKPPMRIAVNRPGNMDGDVSIAMLAAIGVSLDDVKKWGGQVIRAASGEQTSLMLDRRIDMISFGISYKHPRVLEVASSVDIVMLPMKEETVKKAGAATGAAPCEVKKGEYEFLHADSASLCVGLPVLVNASMDEQTAYNITKAMFEQIEKFKGAHRTLAQATTKESLAQDGGVPFHPGALKYLREAGLKK